MQEHLDLHDAPCTLLLALKCGIYAGTRVESVTGPIPGQPGRVRVEGGQTICASQAVVVATEAPAARTLLGGAMASSDSKSEEAVGTANLYFRCGTPLPCALLRRSCKVLLATNAKGTLTCLLPAMSGVSAKHIERGATVLTVNLSAELA